MRYMDALKIILMLSLSGCGSKLFNEEFYNSEIIQARDYAPLGSKYYPRPVYCYKTLAGAECYNDPQPDRSRQFISAYTPAPPRQPVDPNGWNEPVKYAAEEPTFESKPISLGTGSRPPY